MCRIKTLIIVFFLSNRRESFTDFSNERVENSELYSEIDLNLIIGDYEVLGIEGISNTENV